MACTVPMAKTKRDRVGRTGCLTFQLAVGAERPRRKAKTVNGDEWQVREFRGDSLSEIGALAQTKR